MQGLAWYGYGTVLAAAGWAWRGMSARCVLEADVLHCATSAAAAAFRCTALAEGLAQPQLQALGESACWSDHVQKVGSLWPCGWLSQLGGVV